MTWQRSKGFSQISRFRAPAILNIYRSLLVDNLIESKKTVMKKVIALLFSLAFVSAIAQDTALFPRGEKGPNVHHVGSVWLNELNAADSVFTFGVAQAIFEAGARLDWHSHPGGQILLITDGIGYYQEKGKEKRTVKKGDVIKCQPGVEHWHGATPRNGFAYVATSPSQKGKTIWLKRVTDQEYGEK